MEGKEAGSHSRYPKVAADGVRRQADRHQDRSHLLDESSSGDLRVPPRDSRGCSLDLGAPQVPRCDSRLSFLLTFFSSVGRDNPELSATVIFRESRLKGSDYRSGYFQSGSLKQSSEKCLSNLDVERLLPYPFSLPLRACCGLGN